jgi:hypothetical protein
MFFSLQISTILFAAIGSPQGADLVFCRLSLAFHGLGPL